MSSTKPACQDARKWVQERLKDKRCFAPFTGQDARAFAAFTHLLDLYAVADDRERVVKALAATVLSAQEGVRHLFKAAIPWALEWGNEVTLWDAIQASFWVHDREL